jgi:phosphatidylglycerophosphate synthase
MTAVCVLIIDRGISTGQVAPSNMNSITFKAIVRDYRANLLPEEIAGMWGVVLFFRLPGFLVAKAAIFLGISATYLTSSGLVITASIAAAAIFLPSSSAVPAMAALAACFQIVDCADGTVARATGTASLSGRFLDFASDILCRAVCLAAFGLVADGDIPGASPSWLAVGLIAGFCATYARLIRSYAKTLPAETMPGARGTSRLLVTAPYAFLSGLDQLFPFLAFLAWAYGWLDILLVCAAIYHAADAVIAVCTTIASLRASDLRSEAPD